MVAGGYCYGNFNTKFNTMKLKIIVTAMLFLSMAHFANAHQFNMLKTSSPNVATDNVAGVVMDASGNTYVVQNLYSNATTPWTSYSLSNVVGVADQCSQEHASVIVDKITPAGVITNIARIDILYDDISSVTATAVSLYDGKLYIVGYYNGFVYPSGGSVGTRTADGIDMFICSVNTASTGVQTWNQSTGDGEEHATCLNILADGNIFVGGYYTVTGPVTIPGPTSTWPVVGGAVSAPWIQSYYQRIPFIARFTASTLACTQADGWFDPSSYGLSAQINGIVSTLTGGTTYTSYVTGSITGNSTTPVITGGAGGNIPFTGRFINSTTTWGWIVTEGVYYNNVHTDPVSSGKAIILAGSDLYVAGAAAYSGSGPTGYHSGTGLSDAILIRFSSITSSSPTKVWVFPMGGAGNDIANALVYDGGMVCVVGDFSTSSTSTYSFTAYSGGVTLPLVTVPSKVFIAKYGISNPVSGTLDWAKTGDGATATSTISAVASNWKCNTVIGGSFQNKLTWDVNQSNGVASPANHHLFTNLIPVITIKQSNPQGAIASGTNFTTTASGGSLSYIWSEAHPVYSPVMTASVSPGSGATATVSLSSSGGPGRYFEVTTTGAYTRGGLNCSTVDVMRITSTSKKEDEEVTGIEDAIESMNTLNVFPNPFADQIQLDYSFAAPGEGLMQVIDLQGRVVAEKVLTNQSSSETVTTSEWAGGTYIINLSQTGKTIFSKQIVK